MNLRSPKPQQQPRILVVDDDIEIQRVIRRALSRAGYETIACHTAGHALRAAQEIRPAAVLLDANLGAGGIHGFQVCAILKKMAATRNIPVLMMSGVCLGDEFAREARKHGAAGYFSKGDLCENLSGTLVAALGGVGASVRAAPAAPEELSQTGTVLVADDEEDWLFLVRRWLEAQGHTVVTTTAASRVVELSARHLPDCLVLDYQMRGVTATDVCLQLQEHPLTKAIPVVILTGRDGIRNASLDGGADQFVLKDAASAENLARAVSGCIRRRRWSTGLLVKGDLTLDPVHRTAALSGRRAVTLSEERFNFLHYLVQRSPQFAGRAELRARLLRTTENDPQSRALTVLAARTKEDVGPVLGGRIHCLKGLGWLYGPPLVGSPDR